jgi:peptidyl-prolyl cis-trans isomerase SurA
MIVRRALEGLAVVLVVLGSAVVGDGCSGGNSILAVIERDTLDVPAFERYCLKLRGEVPDSINRREELLTRLVNFKIKEHEARRQGLDKDSSYVRETARFNNDLSVSFLLEERLVMPGIRELYEMRKQEMRASHMLIKFHRDYKGRIDTASTRTEAQELLDQLRTGKDDFDSLIIKRSEDVRVSRNKGDLGWFVAGTTLPEMDRMLYNMKPGEIAPHLVRSPFGYHIFKLTGRKKSMQRMDAAHILYRLDPNNPSDTSAGYAHLSLVLDSLRSGLATFEDLARRNSMDPSSGPKGGDLGWVERGGTLDPNFEAALIELKPGQVSSIVRTAYGLHIIKLIEAVTPRTFEEQKNDLKQLYRRFAYPIDYACHLEGLRKTHGFAISPGVVDRIVALVDTTMTTSSVGWVSRIDPGLREAYLFRLDFAPMTVREAIVAIQSDPMLQMKKFTGASIDSIATYLADNMLLNREAERIRNESAEYRAYINDYSDGVLVSMIEQKEVLDKLVIDDSQARSYWQEHKKEFRWPDRVDFSEIFVYDRKTAYALYDSLKAGVDFASLASRHTKRSGFFLKGGSWGMLPVDYNEYSRMASKMETGKFSDVIPMEEMGFSILKLNGRDPAREKTYEEAHGEIATIIRERQTAEVMEKWVQSLRGRYGVKQYNENLALVKPDAR